MNHMVTEAHFWLGTFCTWHWKEKSMCRFMWQKFQQALCISVKKSVHFRQLLMRMYTLSLAPLSFQCCHICMRSCKWKSWLLFLNFRGHRVCNEQNLCGQRSFLTKLQKKMQGQQGTGYGSTDFWILFCFLVCTSWKQLPSNWFLRTLATPHLW